MLVYDATLPPAQKQAVFAWLLIPTPGPGPAAAADVLATIAVTAVGNGTVSLAVCTGGDPVQIEVPYEQASLY